MPRTTAEVDRKARIQFQIPWPSDTKKQEGDGEDTPYEVPCIFSVNADADGSSGATLGQHLC